MRKVAIVVTARPSFARIRTVLESLYEDYAHEVDCRVIMAGSSLLHHYGDVEQDCPFPIAHRVFSTLDGHTRETTAQETGLLTMHLSRIFAEDKPDTVVTIADRHETLATAIAASYQHIPLAHLQGGEMTGSIDDKVRNAVSMLADWHFTATLLSTLAVENMLVKGTVLHTGCPSVDLAARAEVLPEYKNTIVVLQHPVTNESDDAYHHIEETYQAIRAVSSANILWFWPGQDAGTEGIAKHLREHRDSEGGRISFTRHLEAGRFLSVLRSSLCLVGNSSVGIRECAFLGTPVVDIGTRQSGREHGENVVHAPYRTSDIYAAIEHQLDHGRYPSNPLYGDGHAGKRIAEALAFPERVACEASVGRRSCEIRFQGRAEQEPSPVRWGDLPHGTSDRECEAHS